MLVEIARDYLENETRQFRVIGGFLSPVHDDYGKKELLPSEHRVKMCELAVQSSNWIDVSKWEVNQASWVRSLFVLREHKRTLCEEGLENVKVFLLIGADVLESFIIPGIWIPEQLHEILSDFGVVCIERKGTKDLEKLIYEHSLLLQHKVSKQPKRD
jgi:nicotinamide mononucleotide adenylyltransferase